MNKEQIDEIAMRVWNESESECDSRTGRGIITDFTHALLAELAKGSKPIRTAFLNKDGGVTLLMSRSDPSTHPEFNNYLYTTQLPQTDLVADERKEWALLMNADIEQLRKQLSAAQASDTELLKALEEIKLRSISLADAQVVALEAITDHKSRKEKV